MPEGPCQALLCFTSQWRIGPLKTLFAPGIAGHTAESRFMTNRGAPKPLTTWPVCGGDDAFYIDRGAAVFTSTANARWNSGHELVAYIAYKKLTPATRCLARLGRRGRPEPLAASP